MPLKAVLRAVNAGARAVALKAELRRIAEAMVNDLDYTGTVVKEMVSENAG